MLGAAGIALGLWWSAIVPAAAQSEGGVDADRFAPAQDKAMVRKALGFDDSVYLTTVRNLMPRMGLEQLVDAMAIVARRFGSSGICVMSRHTGRGRP